MKVEIELDDSVIAKAAQTAFANMYGADPVRYDVGREGYAAVRRQVVDEVGVQMVGLGVREMIRDTVARRLPGVIEDIVADDLRKRIKAMHADMRKRGELAEPLL